MNRLNENEKIFTEEYYQMNYQNKKHASTQYLFTLVVFLFVSAILAVSIPRYIYAYNFNMTNITDYGKTKANDRLLEYANSSLAPYSKEDFDLSQFDIEPVKPVYYSDVNYYMYSGVYYYGSLPASKVWAHSNDLYARGLIFGADPIQCTSFAQTWFYDIYGFNSTHGATGNGDVFASRVYATNMYYDEEGNLHSLFKYDDHPESLGLVSISGRTPHVLCVDEVNYETGLITISDGNVDGHGAVRIRQTYTLPEFYAANPGYYTFVNPTAEMLEILKNR